MRPYFEYKGHSVIDHNDPDFALYEVTGTNRCFDDLETAIIYLIGFTHCQSDNRLSAYVDTFMTMIQK